MSNSPDYLFSGGHKRKPEGCMFGLLDQRVIGVMRPAWIGMSSLKLGFRHCGILPSLGFLGQAPYKKG